MSNWRRYPTILEINTWVWLTDLSRKYGGPVNLGSVPVSEWDAIAVPGFDAVWLMGVWERSPAGIAISNSNPALVEEFQKALPDFAAEDNVGSAYCVKRYAVDSHVGGSRGLLSARQQLALRGIRLILDFVPNHVAPDHAWVTEYPSYFIQGTVEDLRNDPAAYMEIGERIFANGRDPYFPAWPDVLQLNAFDHDLRQAIKQTLLGIAGLCDGVRCDMAMLPLNDIFERTWGARAGRRPESEYWVEIIQAVKEKRRDFLFLAEAYWDLEWDLQHQGFDYCYDKRLYDRLVRGTGESVRSHLCAHPSYQEKLVRFIENHDEPRAANTFAPEKLRAAAVVMTVPGARLFHEGQLEGREVRVPVFLRRRPEETVKDGLKSFYCKLLAAIKTCLFHEGAWRLCDCSGWPDNQSCRNIVAWIWTKDEDRAMIVVNLSGYPAQARVKVPRDGPATIVRLNDLLSGASYDRSGDEMREAGLYVDLPPWGVHFLENTGKRQSSVDRAA